MLMQSDLTVDKRTERPQYWLCRADDGSRFAYARVQDFYRASDRASDRALWAQLRGVWLVSVRSGTRLARQSGRRFYDAVTGEPLYYYEPDY